MPRQRRTTIIVVGGALAIASVGGYGLGTQADGGTAIADSTTTEQDGSTPDRHGGPPLAFERGAPPGFTQLAAKLGVGTDALARAMRDFHDQNAADRRDEFAAALAKALGIPSSKVKTALDGLRAKHEDRFARPFGGPGCEGPRGELPGREHHDRAMPLRQLANALGVSRADLRKAFAQLRAGAEGHFEQERKALAQFLADRFNLDVSKVQDALAATAPPLMSPHRLGPRDHPVPL